MKNEIPATVKDQIRKHMKPMIDFARSNKQGVCHTTGKSLAIYVHTASVPRDAVPAGSICGQDTVYVEWIGMAGYSHDGLSFTGTILPARDDQRICSAAITFSDALSI